MENLYFEVQKPYSLSRIEGIRVYHRQDLLFERVVTAYPQVWEKATREEVVSYLEEIRSYVMAYMVERDLLFSSVEDIPSRLYELMNERRKSLSFMNRRGGYPGSYNPDQLVAFTPATGRFFSDVAFYDGSRARVGAFIFPAQWEPEYVKYGTSFRTVREEGMSSVIMMAASLADEIPRLEGDWYGDGWAVCVPCTLKNQEPVLYRFEVYNKGANTLKLGSVVIRGTGTSEWVCPSCGINRRILEGN